MDGKNIEIIIPAKEDIDDYEYRITQLIQILASLENKTTDELISQINNLGFDILKYRFKSAKNTQGTFPLIDFPDMIENVKNSIKYSICSEIREESQFRRPFHLSEILMSKCEIGQSEIGSYVIVVKIPSKAILKDEEKDLGRKTVERIMTGIKEFEEMKVDNENEFRKTYNKKLNKNVFDAISKLLEKNGDRFDIEISAKWDYALKPKEKITSKSEIKYSEHYKKINRVSSYLRNIPASKQMMVEGFIEILKNREVDSPDKKRLIIIADTKEKKKVYVWLTETEYKRACDAHRDLRKVRISGFLNKKETHWILEQPENFESAENKISKAHIV
jgi:hypothetical protein